MDNKSQAESSLLKKEIDKLQSELEELQKTKAAAFAGYNNEVKNRDKLVKENADLIIEGNRVRGLILFYANELERIQEDVKEKKKELEAVIQELVDRRKDLQKVRDELNGNT